MSNLITVGGPPGESFKMANTLTTVFVEVLTLAGSAGASTDHERDLVVWLASHDQAVAGRGAVDLELDAMPWVDLDEDRTFLRSTVDAAADRHEGWDRADLHPDLGSLLPALAAFVSLLDVLQASMLRASIHVARRAAPPGYPMCPQHLVLLHQWGCVICNASSVDPPPRI